MAYRGDRGGRGRRGYGGPPSRGSFLSSADSGYRTRGVLNVDTAPNPANVKILQSKHRSTPDALSSPTATSFAGSGHAPFAGPSGVPKIAARPEKAKQENEEKLLSLLPPTMPPASVKLFDDNNCVNKSFLDFLTANNNNFTVVGIIGPQCTGKSTLASMLSGNDPADLYGDYIFRPSPRDYVEKGGALTQSLHIYITKSRMIVIDCQSMISGHFLDVALRQSRRDGIKSALRGVEDDTRRQLMLLFEVCHTIILGIDWFIDMGAIKEVLCAELALWKLKAGMEATARKINFVVAQLRAKSADFDPITVAERAAIVSGIFAESKLDVQGGLSMARLRPGCYTNVNYNVNYVVLAEIKPRPKLDANYVIEEPFGSLLIPFSDMIDNFRLEILNLPKQPFTSSDITERDWLQNVVGGFWEKLAVSDYVGFLRKDHVHY
uniref:Protein SMG9 n=1 Tax=Panagrellus redivivus TaxID=6233 RepID=A0A7E4W7G3_PANRE